MVKKFCTACFLYMSLIGFLITLHYVRAQVALERSLHNDSDENRLPCFAGKFTKGLEHDPATGLLTPYGQECYRRLRKAVLSGKKEDFKAVIQPPHVQKFAYPQGAFSLSLCKRKPTFFKVPPFPSISSKEAAAAIAEVYLMALCRDVLFHEYGTGKGTDAHGTGGSITQDAATYLTALGECYRGPRTTNGIVDHTVLFRWFPIGTVKGPYISQFLLLPLSTILYATFPKELQLDTLPKEPFIIRDQTRPLATAYRDFGVSFADFVALQNGTIPVPYSKEDYHRSTKRFISSGRDLASAVHFDHPSELLYNTLALLFSSGFPRVTGDFFSSVWAHVATVSFEALKAVWVEKWCISRVLRPEAFGGIIHRTLTTGINECSLSSLLFKPHAGIDLFALVKRYNQKQGASTYLLSLAYPEGSPLHPSYPQAHATLAGAGVTIIKAFFDNTVRFATVTPPVKPDPCNLTKLIPLVQEGEQEMTVGSELNKLACNIGAGRNFAGVHYRFDLEEGLRLGEQIALKYLQEFVISKTEYGSKEFKLTSFDGIPLRITAHSINSE